MKLGYSYAVLTAAVLVAGTSAQAASILSEDFESPDVTAADSTGNTSGAVPTGWVGATQGFGASRRGLVDESSGQFTDPTGEQAFAFRYTNSGLTTDAGTIGVLEELTKYTVSFDVVMDGGRNNGTPYNAQFFAVTNGSARNDVRNNNLGTVLASISGDATTDGAYTTVSFEFINNTSDFALIGNDLALRFKGATTSANIDNVNVDALSIPSPTAFTAGLGLAGLLVTRRRRRNG